MNLRSWQPAKRSKAKLQLEGKAPTAACFDNDCSFGTLSNQLLSKLNGPQRPVGQGPPGSAWLLAGQGTASWTAHTAKDRTLQKEPMLLMNETAYMHATGLLL